MTGNDYEYVVKIFDENSEQWHSQVYIPNNCKYLKYQLL